MLEDSNIRNELLEKFFKLAFPPSNLPSSLSFKSTEENPVDLEAKKAEYAPYYEYEHTSSIKYKYDKSGKPPQKKVETLKMKLIDPKPYRELLRKYKLKF